MKYIELSLEQIEELLTQKKIPFDTVGFYDHENFIKEERKDPEFLEIYAAYVNKRNYSEQYLTQAEQIIQQVSNIFSDSMETIGRLGACVDVSTAISRVLDRLGVWNCVIKGCLTICYPSKANLPNSYFWAFDRRSFEAPHAWVYAPPFNVVDLTVKHQKFDKNHSDYLPNCLLAKTQAKAVPQVADIYNHQMMQTVAMHEINKHFNEVTNLQKYIYSTEHVIDGVTFKYIPLAIGASECPLEKTQNIKFEGLYPYEFFKKNIFNKVPSVNNN